MQPTMRRTALALAGSLMTGALLSGALVPHSAPGAVRTLWLPRTGPCGTCVTPDSFGAYAVDRDGDGIRDNYVNGIR